MNIKISVAAPFLVGLRTYKHPCINQAQNRDKWLAVVYMAMNLLVP